MKRKKSAPFVAPTGEHEALLLALVCYASNITSAEVDRMSAEALKVLMENIGLPAERFRAARQYITTYQREFAYGLKRLRVKDECFVIDGPPLRLQ